MSDDTTTLHPIPTTQPQPVTAWLVVTTAATPGTVGRSFRLSADEAIVGRSPEAQVRLMEEGVSRRHARILRSPEGKFELGDLGSTNGTYLNGTKLAAPGRLDEGDRVQLGGQCTLRFTFKETSDGDENLREALAAAQVATFSLDLRNQIIGWNETVERVVGAPAGTLSRTALPMMDFVHPDDRERIRGAVDAAVQGRRQFDAEFRFIRPGNEGSLWVAVKGNVMRDADDTPLRIVGTLMDVSARKQTEQELRREALLFESLNDGVIFLDLQGSVVDWNSSAERLFGYSKGEVLGRAWSDVLKLTENNLQATVLAALRRYGRWSREVVALRKDGSETFCEVTVVPLRDAEGRHIATIAVHRDIGERRAMQAQLLVASRLASVGTLAAGVAHEINNPLAFVNANVLYLADELERSRSALGPATDEILQLVAETRQGVERIGLIVRDLKAFSRVDSEDVTAVVDVRKVLAFAEKMAGKEMRQRARVLRDIQPVPMVKANESRLGQVFLNLLLNAAQAIPDGAATEHEIRIRTRTDGLGRAVVEVSDTGRGIPEELRARVFDPFFTTKPVGEGTGLGLSICLGIVRSLGGEILLESEVGKGSSFRVALPAHQPERSTAILPATELPSSTPVKLLVVDDEPYICTAIQRLLRREHRVTALTTVREALALLEGGERFDVILSDLMMPEQNGEDFYKELNRVAPDQARRMIFMTGGAFTPRSEEFLRSSPVPQVAKPISLEMLQGAIRQVVEDTSRS
ncbi:MAG: PAS domain S-box protein [Myxococcaceae bacterium]